jgi:hypothetical protein
MDGAQGVVSHPFAMRLRMDGAQGFVVSHPFAMRLRMDGAQGFWENLES